MSRIARFCRTFVLFRVTTGAFPHAIIDHMIGEDVQEQNTIFLNFLVVECV